MDLVLNIVLSVVSLILGWYGRGWFEQIVKSRRLTIIRRREEIGQSRGPGWLVDYYINAGEGHLLFTLPNGKKIPYLSRPQWQTVNPTGLRIQYVVEEKTSVVTIDKLAIRDRELAGQRLWDGPVYCLGGIVANGQGFDVVLRNCSYFQYASLASQLRNETFRCLEAKRRAPKLRDKAARTIVQLEAGMLGAQIVGFTTAIVIESDDDEQVLIQTRSHETGIAQGRLAVIPSFVCNPSMYDRKSCLPIDRHFFLLEFLEELYDRKELEREHSRITPGWFYSEPPADMLSRLLEIEGTEARFRVLGFGFDLNTGELHIATSISIRDSEFSDSDRQRLKYNYEVNHVEQVSLRSERLMKLTLADNMYVTSAFTLSCLLRSRRLTSSDVMKPALRVLPSGTS